MFIKEKPKWKPLHERIVDELINGKDEKHEEIIEDEVTLARAKAQGIF